MMLRRVTKICAFLAIIASAVIYPETAGQVAIYAVGAGAIIAIIFLAATG